MGEKEPVDMSVGRTLAAGLFISLDGVVEASEGCHIPYVNEMGTAIGQLYAEADTLLLGRVTYEAFAALWPHQTIGTGQRLFPDGATPASLTLTRSVAFSTGVLDLTYQPS